MSILSCPKVASLPVVSQETQSLVNGFESYGITHSNNQYYMQCLHCEYAGNTVHGSTAHHLGGGTEELFGLYGFTYMKISAKFGNILHHSIPVYSH